MCRARWGRSNQLEGFRPCDWDFESRGTQRRQWTLRFLAWIRASSFQPKLFVHIYGQKHDAGMPRRVGEHQEDTSRCFILRKLSQKEMIKSLRCFPKTLLPDRTDRHTLAGLVSKNWHSPEDQTLYRRPPVWNPLHAGEHLLLMRQQGTPYHQRLFGFLNSPSSMLSSPARCCDASVCPSS